MTSDWLTSPFFVLVSIICDDSQLWLGVHPFHNAMRCFHVKESLQHQDTSSANSELLPLLTPSCRRPLFTDVAACPKSKKESLPISMRIEGWIKRSLKGCKLWNLHRHLIENQYRNVAFRNRSPQLLQKLTNPRPQSLFWWHIRVHSRHGNLPTLHTQN